MTTAPRCTEPGCPVRYRGGPDRACPIHADDYSVWDDRLDAMIASMTAPGDGDDDAT